jgi:hypothetical protein
MLFVQSNSLSLSQALGDDLTKNVRNSDKRSKVETTTTAGGEICSVVVVVVVVVVLVLVCGVDIGLAPTLPLAGRWEEPKAQAKTQSTHFLSRRRSSTIQGRGAGMASPPPHSFTPTRSVVYGSRIRIH